MKGGGLLQPGQDGFDGVEVGQVLGGGGLLGVLHDPGLVDDEGGAGGGVADAGQQGEHDFVFLDDFLVQVAGEGDGIFSFWAQASWANGLSTLTPMTLAPRSA